MRKTYLKPITKLLALTVLAVSFSQSAYAQTGMEYLLDLDPIGPPVPPNFQNQPEEEQPDPDLIGPPSPPPPLPRPQAPNSSVCKPLTQAEIDRILDSISEETLFGVPLPSGELPFFPFEITGGVAGSNLGADRFGRDLGMEGATWCGLRVRF